MLKNHKEILIVIMVGFISIVSGTDKTGFLSVTVQDSMYIYIDTTLVGKHSFSNLELPVGNYTVHAYNPYALNWSYRGVVEKIQIAENDYISLDFTKTDQVKVLSLPFGSKVFSGDDLLGTTPLTYNRNLNSTSSLRIEKFGYVGQSFKINQDQDKYQFILQPAQNIDQPKVSRISDNQNGLKWYREGLIVTSLLTSWASFYYKRQADESYARYQRSSDSSQINAFYNQTQRYDTISEIAIAVSVATLGTYVYLLLTD